MTKRCSFKVHPDGYNGELPHLHEFAQWKLCEEPMVVVLTYPYSTGGGIPACDRHAALFREGA